MRNDYWKKLTEKYFEAQTSPAEERALRRFLARTDDPWFDEVKAVAGYLSAAGAAHRAAAGTPAPASRTFRPLPLALVAACAAILITVGVGLSRRPACVTITYGVANSDREQVLLDARNTLTELFADNQGPDVAAQLEELFQ